jgi:hypothetical protein
MDNDKCDCNLGKAFCDASAEELAALYKFMTGQDPKPGQINAMKGGCKLSGIEFGSAQMSEAEKADITIIPDLIKSVAEENDAISTYREREENAAKAGDAATEQAYRHVIGEEMQHASEFSQAIGEKTRE